MVTLSSFNRKIIVFISGFLPDDNVFLQRSHLLLAVLALAVGLCSGAPPDEEVAAEGQNGLYEYEDDGFDEDEEVDVGELRKLVPDGFEIVEVILVEEDQEKADQDSEEEDDDAYETNENEVYGAESGWGKLA